MAYFQRGMVVSEGFAFGVELEGEMGLEGAKSRRSGNEF